MSRFVLDDTAWASPWRSRPVGEKAFLTLGLLLVALTTDRPTSSLLVLAVAVGVAVVAAVPLGTYLRALAAPATFIAIGLLGIVVTFDDGARWSWGPLGVSVESLQLAAQVGTRSLACAAAVMLLATTTPVSDLLQASRRARVPATVVEIAGVVYRMIFLLLDAQAGIREAQAGRLGYASRASATRSFGGLAAATLARAWTTALELEDGLTGRGYTGVLPHVDRARPRSPGFIAGSAALLLAVAAVSAAARLGWWWW